MACEILFLDTVLFLLSTTSIAGLRRITASESQDVQLPCCIEFSSSSTPTETIWRKEGDAEHLLRVWLSLEIATSIGRQLELTGNHRPYLLLKNLSEANSGVYKCYSGHITGRSFLFNISSQEYLELTFPAGAPVYLPCGFSKSSNWTTHFWQSVNGSFNLDVNFNVTLEVQRGARPLGAVLFKTIDLLIPAVRLEDAGVYNCSWGENSDVIELEVIALSKWGKIFGNSYWIIVAGTGGSLALSAVFWGICLLTIKQIKARRKRQKATSRSFFRITASSTPNPYIDAPATLAGIGKETHNEDGDLYVNVDLGKFEEDPKKLRKKSIESDDSLNVTSEDGGCYENTNEEVKPCPKGSNSDATVLFFILNGEEAMGMPDGGSYINRSELLTVGAKDIISTDGTCYENPAGLSKVVKDDKVSNRGACYENSEQLPITGQGIISGFLTPTPSNSVGMADGESEKSTGSQSYEDMEGAIYMVPTRNLLQCSDRSQDDENLYVGRGILKDGSKNQEDGDSYENMEGQTFAVQLNQRSPWIEEEYDNMDKDSHLTVHFEDQTMDAKQVQQQVEFQHSDVDFYLTFDMRRTPVLQKIPSFKIKNHEVYDSKITDQKSCSHSAHLRKVHNFCA